MFVKISVRNFEDVKLTDDKNNQDFCQFLLFWYVGFLSLLFTHQFWGKMDEIYSSKNVTSFVYYIFIFLLDMCILTFFFFFLVEFYYILLVFFCLNSLVISYFFFVGNGHLHKYFVFTFLHLGFLQLQRKVEDNQRLMHGQMLDTLLPLNDSIAYKNYFNVHVFEIFSIFFFCIVQQCEQREHFTNTSFLFLFPLFS